MLQSSAWLRSKSRGELISLGFLLGYCICLLSGCQESSVIGQPIKGVVLVGDVPLDRGLVTLVPIEDTRGPRVTAVVVNGLFQLPAETGPWPGKYRVEVNTTPPELRAMAEGRPRKSISPQEMREFREIHPNFNSKSDVTIQVLTQRENKYRIQARWEEPPRAEAEVMDSSAVLHQYVGVAEHRRARTELVPSSRG